MIETYCQQVGLNFVCMSLPLLAFNIYTIIIIFQFVIFSILIGFEHLILVRVRKSFAKIQAVDYVSVYPLRYNNSNCSPLHAVYNRSRFKLNL